MPFQPIRDTARCAPRHNPANTLWKYSGFHRHQRDADKRAVQMGMAPSEPGLPKTYFERPPPLSFRTASL
jgi:hypothetical protein